MNNFKDSLAIKYRPKCWAEVCGQDAIVSILNSQVINSKIKHAYLFCGPYGCGKTTVARILANQINNNIGEPIEIDAASNNGIDNIRAIISDAQQMPLDCNFKIYIIDECHQLTKQAWDAALKIIEEPPETAIFIFCTTNPNKVPSTILSRTQRFDFKPVNISVIADRLEYILNEEIDNCKFDRKVLERIAYMSKGHMRDAIQLLDKCLDYSNNLSIENCNIALETVDFDLIFDFIINILLCKQSEAINSLINFDGKNIDIYDNFIQCLLDICTYNIMKSELALSMPLYYKDKELFNLSKSFKNNPILILEQFLKYKKFINENNLVAILKIICIEIGTGGMIV